MTAAAFSDADRDAPPALEIHGLSKTFAGIPALSDIHLTIRRGEIRGLLGHNGSGKSTLVKILAGYHPPDEHPKIRINGTALEIPFSIDDVRSAGMGFVHQDMALVEECSAADNLGFSASGFQRGRFGRIRWPDQYARASELFARVGLSADPRSRTADLSQAQRALLAIARAQGEFEHERESVLILDEPTATLPAHEVEILFESLRALAARGASILYISHRLPELLSLTDSVTIFRDGRLVTTVATRDASEQMLAEQMLGTTVESHARSERTRAAVAELLHFDGVATATLRPTDLALDAGEILAVSGPVGSGAAELGRVIYGLSQRTAGSVVVDGEPLTELSPRAVRAAGIAYLPSDRLRESSFPELTVAENLLMTDYHSVSRVGHIRGRAARREVIDLLREFAVQPPEPDRMFKTLSGGNQQKVLIAKWLRLRPRVLIVDEPTQGIDISTRLDIYARLREAVEEGLGIIWITSDFEEAATVADRVATFADGRLCAILEGEGISADAIAHASFVQSA
jgi:ribose transport system ATP-binding protein